MMERWGRTTKEVSEVQLKHEIISNLLTNRVHLNNHNRHNSSFVLLIFVRSHWVNSLMESAPVPMGTATLIILLSWQSIVLLRRCMRLSLPFDIKQRHTLWQRPAQRCPRELEITTGNPGSLVKDCMLVRRHRLTR